MPMDSHEAEINELQAALEDARDVILEHAATISQLQAAHVVLALKLGDEEVKVAKQAAELDKWREREASVCPEDYGFEEVITQQAATIKELENKNPLNEGA